MPSPAAPRLRSNTDASVLIVRSRYDAFEGNLHNGPYLRLALATSRGGRFYQRVDDVTIEGPWRAGSLCVTLPHQSAESRTSPIEILGLAVDLDRHVPCDHCRMLAADFAAAASTLTADALLSSVMTALWHEAEAHGASSAFFDHGVSLILDRLARIEAEPRSIRPAAPLSPARFRRVVELIESRLGGDVSVAELAAETGQDSSGFTRAFRVTTGYTPFVYLTMRRMERAKLLLAGGASVTAVAGEVGYANPSKFAAAFRQICGCPPSHWRAARR